MRLQFFLSFVSSIKFLIVFSTWECFDVEGITDDYYMLPLMVLIA